MLAYLPKSCIRTLFLSVDNLQSFPLEVTSSTTRCTDGDSEEQGENQHNDWKGYIKMFLIFLVLVWDVSHKTRSLSRWKFLNTSQQNKPRGRWNWSYIGMVLHLTFRFCILSRDSPAYIPRWKRSLILGPRFPIALLW